MIFEGLTHVAETISFHSNHSQPHVSDSRPLAWVSLSHHVCLLHLSNTTLHTSLPRNSANVSGMIKATASWINLRGKGTLLVAWWYRVYQGCMRRTVWIGLISLMFLCSNATVTILSEGAGEANEMSDCFSPLL